ncbi:MAG TPA: hypothetical protein VEC16_06160 [Alphaproteobacteria bacterium]|nr:hypothetical protein [Alphaproteobacteria bacterium]
MALNGWHWTVFGLIIALVSGWVYITTSKGGEPNNAMALFFFIGIIFLIIGVLKLFFKRVDDKKVFDAVAKSENSNEVTALGNSNFSNTQARKDLSVQMDIVQPKEQNKIDEAIANMAKEQEAKKPLHHASHPAQHAKHQGTHTLQTGHTNTYAKTHHYHGPVKTATNNSANATHPINSHIQPKGSSEHSIKCRRCGNVNASTASYCHSCGNRLK